MNVYHYKCVLATKYTRTNKMMSIDIIWETLKDRFDE